MSNFLDTDSTLLENKLRFVKNEFEDEMSSFLQNPESSAKPRDLPFKLITPDPGLCIKTYKLIDNAKIFLNICQSDGIPAPEDINTEKLTEILSQEDENTNYRVPMSITELRQTKDKSGLPATVCDIAIHPNIYKKVEKVELFRTFLVTIIFEALDTKYNCQINKDNWIVLKNRKFMGRLITHRVQNRDVKEVYDSYKTRPDDRLYEALDGKKKLIEEINIKTLLSARVPEYRLVLLPDGKQIVAEFLLTGVIAADEINLEIGADRIFLEVPKRGYYLDEFLDYNLDQDNVTWKFNNEKKILTVTLNVL